jgi:hypothetical protein
MIDISHTKKTFSSGNIKAVSNNITNWNRNINELKSYQPKNNLATITAVS